MLVFAAGQRPLVAVEGFDDDMMTGARLADKALQEAAPDARGRALEELAALERRRKGIMVYGPQNADFKEVAGCGLAAGPAGSGDPFSLCKRELGSGTAEPWNTAKTGLSVDLILLGRCKRRSWLRQNSFQVGDKYPQSHAR
jgi:hypothetical protein